MKFEDFYILNEAGFNDRISYLVKKHGKAWNNHWTWLAGVAGSEEGELQFLTPEEMKSPKTQKDDKRMAHIVQKMNTIASNAYANAEENENYDDDATRFEHDEAMDTLENVLPLHRLAEPTLGDGINEEFADVALAMDPGASEVAFDRIRNEFDVTPEDRERIKPLYTEWIILSFIRGDWDDTVMEMTGREQMTQFNDQTSKIRMWSLFEDAGMIRNTLTKFAYYKEHYPKQFIDANKESYHENTPPIKDALNINQYKAVVADHMNTGDLSTWHGFSRLQAAIRQVESKYSEITMERTKLGNDPIDKIPGTEIIGTNDKYVALELTDMEGTELLCRDMGWCIESEQTFNDYSEDGPLIIFGLRDGDKFIKAKYLLHGSSAQAKARDNRSMAEDEVTEILDIVLKIPELQRLVAYPQDEIDKLEPAVEYVRRLNRLVVDGEWRMIFKFLKVLSPRTDTSSGQEIARALKPGETVHSAIQKLQMYVDVEKETIAKAPGIAWQAKLDSDDFQKHVLAIDEIVDPNTRQDMVKLLNVMATEMRATDKPGFWAEPAEEHYATAADLLMRDIKFIYMTIWRTTFDIIKERGIQYTSEQQELSTALMHAMGTIADPYSGVRQDMWKVFEGTYIGDFQVFRDATKTREQSNIMTSTRGHYGTRGDKMAEVLMNFKAKFYELVNREVGKYVPRKLDAPVEIDGTSQVRSPFKVGTAQPINVRFIMYALYRSKIFEKVTPLLVKDEVFRSILLRAATARAQQTYIRGDESLFDQDDQYFRDKEGEDQ